MHRLLLLFPIVLSGCGILDGILGGDGTPVLIATDSGQLIRLSVSEDGSTSEWSASIASANKVSLTEDGDLVFVGAADQVAAFSLSDGVAAWSAPATLPQDIVAVAGPSDGVVLARSFDWLFGLDAADGSELWRQDLLLDLPDAADEALAAGGGVALLGGDPIRRIDPTTGDVDGQADVDDPAVSQIVIAGGVAYVGLVEGVTALPLNGDFTRSWTLPTDADVDFVAVSGDTVAYAILGSGVGLATTAGAPIAASDSTEVLRGLVLADGLAIGARSDAGLVAWDATTAEEVWTVDGSGGDVWGIAADADTVYYAADGVLEGIATIDGSLLFSSSSSGDVVAVHPL